MRRLGGAILPTRRTDGWSLDAVVLQGRTDRMLELLIYALLAIAAGASAVTQQATFIALVVAGQMLTSLAFDHSPCSGWSSVPPISRGCSGLHHSSAAPS